MEGGKPVINLPKGPLKRLDKLIDLYRKLDDKQKTRLRKLRAETKKTEPRPTAGAIGTYGSHPRHRIHFRRKIVYGPKGKRRTIFTPYQPGSRGRRVSRGRHRVKGLGVRRQHGFANRSNRKRERKRERARSKAPRSIRFVCSRCGKQTVFKGDAKSEALERDLVACERLVVEIRLFHPEVDLDMDTGSLCRDCNPELGKVLNEKLGNRFSFKGEAPKLILNVRAPKAAKLPVNARVLEAVLRLANDEPLRDKSLEKWARKLAKILGF